MTMDIKEILERKRKGKLKSEFRRLRSVDFEVFNKNYIIILGKYT